MTFDGSTVKVFSNGVETRQLSVSGQMTATDGNVRLGARSLAPPESCWVGLIDEVDIFNRALSSNEIAAIYNAGSAGKCLSPEIITQPESQLGAVGGTAQFSVSAIPNRSSLAYQWQTNGVAISGATNQTLVLTNLQVSNAGAYTVVVLNSYGSVTSAPPATLTVNYSSIALYTGLTLYGNLGSVYGIQASTNLSDTNGWFGLANVTLTNTFQLWYDSIPATLSERFYRVLPGTIPIP